MLITTNARRDDLHMATSNVLVSIVPRKHYQCSNPQDIFYELRGHISVSCVFVFLPLEKLFNVSSLETRGRQVRLCTTYAASAWV